MFFLMQCCGDIIDPGLTNLKLHCCLTPYEFIVESILEGYFNKFLFWIQTCWSTEIRSALTFLEVCFKAWNFLCRAERNLKSLAGFNCFQVFPFQYFSFWNYLSTAFDFDLLYRNPKLSYTLSFIHYEPTNWACKSIALCVSGSVHISDFLCYNKHPLVACNSLVMIFLDEKTQINRTLWTLVVEKSSHKIGLAWPDFQLLPLGLI